MKYAEDKDYVLYQGRMQDVIDAELKENSIDCIITDPPYGLTSITDRFGKEGSAPAQEGTDGAFKRLSKGFMGQTWDGSGVEYDIETWKRCFNVLKPGGYLLAFGGTRTFHRIACAIEDAGFDIRDTIMWLYGSGFPKSMNIGLKMDKSQGCPDRGHRIAVANRHHPDGTLEPNGDKLEPYEAKTELGKKWNGWGTCLKPAYEPIIVARKPFKGSLVENILEYGIGGLNIDECRVGSEVIKGGTTPDFKDVGKKTKETIGINKLSFGQAKKAERIERKDNVGRFPANVILTYDETDFDEVCGGFPNTKSTYNKDSKHEAEIHRQNADTLKYGYKTRIDSSSYNVEGSAARYFYCAKANNKDRDEGLEDFESNKVNDGRGTPIDNAFQRGETLRKNIHPTVKPTDLMQYLVRLVAPKGAVILDPFMGSGSTGKAVMFENRERNADYKFIGIEMTEDYLPICKARIDYAKNKYEYDKEKEEVKSAEYNTQSLFDYMGDE